MILLVLAAAFHGGPIRQARAEAAGPLPEPAGLPASVAPGSGQLLVVVPVRTGSSLAFLYALERAGCGWATTAGPLDATLGRKGFARPGKKREGDGHTPAGLFPLEFAFGYAPAIETRMPYRQATADDLWVDDAGSPDYNRWVRRGGTNAKSFEEMRLPDHRYRYGLVIGYNRNPVTPGLGSAIFIHVRREAGAPTAGCVALAEADLVALLAWLDPAKKPAILMGDPSDLTDIPGLAGFAAPAPSRIQGNLRGR